MTRPQLILAPYQPGDIERFTPRADFAAELEAVNWAWPDGPPPGRTWTLLRMGAPFVDVLGVGGLYDAGGGHWQAWAILGELTKREWCVAGALALDAIDGVELFNAPEEITATARLSIPGAVQVLTKLGFLPTRTITDPRLGEDVVYQHMVRAA